MTTTLPPVPQISFAGQAAAAPGPCDLVAMYVMHLGARAAAGLARAGA